VPALSIWARTRGSFRQSLLHAIPMAFGIVVLDFLLLKLLPGDAADVIAGESGSATAQTLAALRSRFGLDQPILTQLLNYLDNLAHLNLGFSAHYDSDVFSLIVARMPATLLLMLSAFMLALVFGIAVGWIMAAFAGSWLDRVLTVLVLFFYSTPGFWIGLMSIVFFSVKLRWLPSTGSMTIGVDLHGVARFIDRARYLILPAITLATFSMAIYARLTRAAMLEVQTQDFIRTATSKGLHPFIVQFRHALRNALIPVTTVAGLHLANLLGGAVVVETVFGWPGLGQLALDAVLSRDFNVLLGILLMSSFLVILVNAVMDLIHAWLDPRIGTH
jgi:peptide/nickel transport system permease protein